jgi:hypothetical protein
MSCPAGFEVGINNTCRITCPSDYKYLQSSSGDKCVASNDNRYSITLQAVPQGSSTKAFSDEQSRFITEVIKTTQKAQKDADALTSKTVESAVYAHDQIRSTNDVAGTYAEAIAELKPLRPPTQPHQDIMLERLSIDKLNAQDIRTLQICLFFIVITLFEYLVLPAEIVHGAAFFTLCVGTSVAIYLSNR